MEGAALFVDFNKSPTSLVGNNRWVDWPRTIAIVQLVLAATGGDVNYG
jgi:hypothetical protein